MSKHGWTYKTFGEVGSFLRGKSIQKADFIENGFPCIHNGQIHTKFGVSVDKHLSEIPLELYNKSIIASHGDVIIAITSEDLEGSCKSTAWLGDYDVAVSSHAAVYKHNINPKFIAYYLRSKSFYYEKMKYARGFKVVEIKPTDIERIPIPVPPAAEQERIVAELDLLSGIIEKKKEQLKAYDQLAQSIFYSMFGDPIDNPKGWETKKLGDECNEIKYGTSRPASENGKFKYLRMGNITYDGALDLSDLRTIDIPDDEVEKYIVRFGDILFNRTNSLDLIGKTCMFDLDEPMIIAGYIIRVRLTERLNPRYVSALLNLPTMKLLLKKMAKGAVNQANINSKELASIRIPVPPLSLQQEFAEKIEAIERQKTLVQQSIDETQTMFDYTMDKYFG